MKEYRAVEQLTLRYTLFCRARISRLLVKSENPLSSISKMIESLIDGGFVADIDIYRSKLIALYNKGKKRCTPFGDLLKEMERYRTDVSETITDLLVDEFGQPFYDSSVFVSNDREKIRTVIKYFANRTLLAFLFRAKMVIESRASNTGIDDSAHNTMRRALTPGSGYFVGVPPDESAAGFSYFPNPA